MACRAPITVSASAADSVVLFLPLVHSGVCISDKIGKFESHIALRNLASVRANVE